MTMKMPNPIPASKIPAIAAHELTIEHININAPRARRFEFFIVDIFLVGAIERK